MAHDEAGMGQDLTIRRATVADQAALTRLRLALFRAVGDLPDPAAEAAFVTAVGQYLATEVPKGRFLAWLACTATGAAVGCGGLVFVQKPPSAMNPTGREGYVMNMYTDPAWRGRGIARQIMAEILTAVREAGVTLVRLHATEAGRPIYQQLGFQPTADELVLTLATQ